MKSFVLNTIAERLETKKTTAYFNSPSSQTIRFEENDVQIFRLDKRIYLVSQRTGTHMELKRLSILKAERRLYKRADKIFQDLVKQNKPKPLGDMDNNSANKTLRLL